MWLWIRLTGFIVKLHLTIKVTAAVCRIRFYDCCCFFFLFFCCCFFFFFFFANALCFVRIAVCFTLLKLLVLQCCMHCQFGFGSAVFLVVALLGVNTAVL